MISSNTGDNGGSNGLTRTERARRQLGADEAPRNLGRRSVLLSSATVTGALFLSGYGLARPSSAQQTQIPRESTYYAVRLVGQSPNEGFDREGVLLVTPPVDTTGATQINARDVVLRSGSPPSVPEAGAIWYATNTALYTAVDIPATSVPQEAAQLDVATVEEDGSGGVLSIQPDANLARAAQLNVFTARTSLVAGLFNVIDGLVEIQFQNGQQITGTVDFTGVAPTGAASDQSRLVMEFAGAVTTPQ